ncbi:MAG: hypothetical protein IKG56_02940 [Clostridia bacterium]|nr:hypothetical protein [Clostridia bacterium]
MGHLLQREYRVQECIEEEVEIEQTFTVSQICRIFEMAREGKVPDWHYSDNECCLWEIFRRYLREE